MSGAASWSARAAVGRLALAAAALLSPGTSHAQQALPASGRLSVYFTTGSFTDLQRQDGDDHREFREVTTSVSWRSAEAVEGGTEFAFDGRGAVYPGTAREGRMSVYDGYVGYRTRNGVGVRGGQMWINDLGGLGSVAGLLVETRRKNDDATRVVRVGVFGGLEPGTLDLEYVPGVRKMGGYVTYESGATRRHVLGYVNVQNSGLTERSVLTTTNFLRSGRRFFVYQAGEFDLTGVGGNGSARLSYFLTNGRALVSRRVEVLGSYHRGRSIDARSLALDVLQGVPISTQRTQGLLFESVGGRVWVTVVPGVRATGGYYRDRTNRGEQRTDRYQAGANAWNVAGSGVDVNVMRSSISGPGRSYTAWDASIGRPIGSRLYLTGDFSTNLSSVRLADDLGGFTIEHRPRTRRYGITTLANLTRHYSLLFTADRTDEGDAREHRELVGLTVRF